MHFFLLPSCSSLWGTKINDSDLKSDSLNFFCRPIIESVCQYLPNLSFLGITHQWGTHQMRSLDHVPYAPHVPNPESQRTIHFPRTYKSILFYLNKLLGMFMENLISNGLFPLATKYIFTLSFTF